jgi:hypothetical protein
VLKRSGAALVIGAALAAAAAGLASWRWLAGDASPEGARADGELLAQLHSLGYLDSAELAPGEAKLQGVTLEIPERSQPGVNLFLASGRSEARLIDASGRALHVWSLEASRSGWHHVELAPDGTLYAIRRDGDLFALDARSRVLWRRPLGAHHDLALLPSGEIAVLRSVFIEVPYQGRALPLVDDRVAVLSPGGELLREISLHRLFGARIPAERLAQIASHPPEHWRERAHPPRRGVDVFHTNSVEVLEADVPGLGRRGDFLLSIRELDLLAVVDPGGEQVRWSWGEGELESQHAASVTRDGNVLVFDNGIRRGFSRVLEIDPASRRIVWERRGDPPGSFFSRRMGACQALANGNRLVTSSEQGTVFEITREGERVWEFWTPDVDAQRSRRATLYRMTRYPAEVTASLASHGGP